MTQNPDAGAGTPISLAGLRAGTDVGGYRLLRRLGAGGMGVVWEVADGEGNHVAMKILHPQIAADPMARRRLDREASVLARVKDSRVARILDIETGDGADGSGVTFVITELVDGPTLQHEVDYEGAYDLSTDARDLSDLAHGLVDSLSAVHAAGVIHRDLKPSNVMLGVQGPVLIDFGIAQVADDVRLTQTGQVTGTPGFIPPEMLDGDEPSPGVDWYACAGVLLFAVTGRAPFGSGPWQAVFRRVYAGTPELGTLEDDCPALGRAFTAALAPEAADRLGIDDLLRVLDDIADGGTGEEVIEEILGEDEPSEADTATGTYAPGYGVMAVQQPSGYGSGPSASSAGTGPRPGIPSGGYGGGPAPVGTGRPGAYGYLGASASGAPGSASASSSMPSAPSVPSVPPTSGAAGAVGAPPRFPPDDGRPGPATPQAGMRMAGAPAAYAPGSGTGPQQARFGPPQSGPAQSAPTPSGPARPTPRMHSPALPATKAAPSPSPALAPTPAPQASQPARPTGVQPAVSAAPSASLPQWASEPRRHPIVVFSLFALLVALSACIPVWVAIVFAIALVVAGTVGRADDARRWRRLEAGHASAGDTARMWAGMPWYLLRSLVANVFTAIPALLVTAIVFLAGRPLTGTDSQDVTVLTSWSDYHRLGLLLYAMAVVLLLVAWFVPWGTPTRRGAARMIGAALGDGSGLVFGTAFLLALALGLFILHTMGALPVYGL